MWIILHLINLAFINLTTSAGPPVSVFSQTGGSITLEFQQHQQLERKDLVTIEWRFSSEKIMLYIPLADNVLVFTHKDRVVFNKETFSLELKDLQKNDSGLYKGHINAGQNDIWAEYRISIQDPVQAPILTVISNWSSSDFCNATVTCKGRDLNLTSTCNSRICFSEEGVFRDSLTLFVRGGRIICNYSNPVSWSNDTIEIKPLCPFNQEQNITPSEGATVALVLVLVISCLGFLLFMGWRSRRFRAALRPTQTEYDTVANQQQPHNVRNSAHQGTSPISGPQDKTVYSTVTPQRKPAAAGENPKTLESRSLESDTIYSMVNTSSPVVKKT